jgi:formate dehydrogenase beta subunit
MKCTRVFDEQKRFNPEYDNDIIETVKADAVIVTIGQQVDAEIFAGVDGLVKGPGGTVKVNNNLSVGIEGIFAAGDVARGPSSVIDAIAAGRYAADIIDKYLGGIGLVEEVSEKAEIKRPDLNTPADEFHQPRQKAIVAAPGNRTAGFGLIQKTLSEPAARMEAQRCLRCHIRLGITPVKLPPERWLPLNRDSIDSIPETDGVFQLFNAEKKVIRISGTPNLRQSLSECLDNPGEAQWFIWEEDPMYTKRESELIQQYLQKYGELPGGGAGGDDLDDLF